MTEFIIGMAIALVVCAASLELFALGHRAVEANTQRIAQQQDLRLGLEVFEQEMRLSAAETILAIREDAVEFLANIHGNWTNTTAAITPGQSVLPVVEGRGWERGKLVKLCKPLVCETHRLLNDGRRNQLILERAVETEFPAGSSVEMHNHVIYYTRAGDSILLMRMVDGGAGVLVADLKAVRFSYWDRKGRRTNSPSQVARVVLEIEPSYSWRSEFRDVALRS
ncbi:MAG: hypothetical protein NNA18_07725 [Nitrospira sp.]|nr:hypothetical protein [Nitrospira sp.]